MSERFSFEIQISQTVVLVAIPQWTVFVNLGKKGNIVSLS